MSSAHRVLLLSFLFLLAVGFAAGCGSVTNPGPDQVIFQTDPSGASVSIDGNRLEGKTPLTAMVARKAQYVTFSLPGYEETKVPVAREWNKASGGNFWVGGMAGTMYDGANGNTFQAKPTMMVKLDKQ